MLDPRIDTFLTVCQCMSFTAADGTQHNLMITMGGRGADEACPYNASEY